MHYSALRHSEVSPFAGLIFCLSAAICLAWPCSSSAVEPPFTYRIPAYNDLIVVSATLDGVGHLCVIDSGSSTNVFDSRFRDKLGESLGAISIETAGGGKVRGDVFPSPSVSLAAIVFSRDGHVFCSDMSGIREATGLNIEGILGVPLFREMTVLIDFDSQQVTFSRENIAPASNWGSPIDVAYCESALPMIDINLSNRIKTQCEVDTGSTSSISLPSKEFNELVRNGEIKLLDSTITMRLNGQRTSRSGIISSVCVGKFENRDLLVKEGGDKPQIGLQYLRRFHVTFDLRHDRIYLAKGAKFNEPDKQPIGMGILRKGHKTVVSSVQRNSLFAKAGGRVNDELISVAGLSVTDRPSGEIRWLIREKADSNGEVTLDFRRDGKEHRLSIYIPD